MRVVTWNCNGGLRKKLDTISKLDADLYIIQECEDPSQSDDLYYTKWANNSCWIGDSRHKGLGVFAGENIKLERLNWPDRFEGRRVKHFLPCLVDDTLQLLAVWTHYNNSPTYGYIGQFWKYMQLNKLLFEDIIIAGDFNSNVFWDKPRRSWNHSDVTNELNEHGIVSAYHLLHGEEQGKESIPTFYHHRDLKKAYHIDYFYIKNGLLSQDSAISVGERIEWLELSDHLPLQLDI